MFQKWYSVHVHGEVTDYKHGFLFIVLCSSILSVTSSWMWQVNTLQTNCHNTGWSLADLKCKSQNYYHLVYKLYCTGRTQQFRNMKLKCICILVFWTLLWWSYHFIRWGSHFLLLFIIVDMLIVKWFQQDATIAFILRNGFTLHVSGDNSTHHQEYNAVYDLSGRQVYLCCNFVNILVVLSLSVVLSCR